MAAIGFDIKLQLTVIVHPTETFSSPSWVTTQNFATRCQTVPKTFDPLIFGGMSDPPVLWIYY